MEYPRVGYPRHPFVVLCVVQRRVLVLHGATRLRYILQQTRRMSYYGLTTLVSRRTKWIALRTARRLSKRALQPDRVVPRSIDRVPRLIYISVKVVP